jgi:hypothetical protein
MQRHIMVPGHDNLRLWQLIEESSRFAKLPRARALSQITRNSHQVRFDFVYDSD